MELIKRHKTDNMLNIYKCHCGNLEYYGAFYWHDGIQCCRCCIYNIWETEGYEHAKMSEKINAISDNREPDYSVLKYWKPSESDYIFPLYLDGIDYTKEEDQYVDSE